MEANIQDIDGLGTQTEWIDPCVANKTINWKNITCGQKCSGKHEIRPKQINSEI